MGATDAAAHLDGRLAREQRTVQVMIELYCRCHHQPHSGLCPDCQELLDYALKRVATCPYQSGKPTCAKCPVHCYRRDRREQVRQVMRFSGPRMLLHHPWLALRHYLDGWRCLPEVRPGVGAARQPLDASTTPCDPGQVASDEPQRPCGH